MILNSCYILEVLLNSKIFKNIILQIITLTVILTLISFFTLNKEFSLGVLVGGAVASVNFAILLFVVKKIFFGEPKTQIIYAILFMFKLFLIGGVILWLFQTSLFTFSKAGFLAGITILFIIVTINGLIYGNKLKTEVN